MSLMNVCMTLSCMVFASLSQLSECGQCDTCPKEGSLGSRTSTFAITGGASVTNNVLNVITGLWAMYPLMVTAEPDVNAFSKYDELNRPDIDCLFVPQSVLFLF